MRLGSRARRALLPWALAVAWLVVLDAVLAHTRVLWGPTTFEDARDLRGLVFAQMYQAARTLASGDAPQVTLLGNSRIWLAARPRVLAAALPAGPDGAPPRVDGLSVFGAGLADVAMIARHLPPAPPRTVVLGVGTTDLVPTSVTPLAGPSSTMLATGWADGPLGPDPWPARLDRWTRTVWPLWRWREFTRAALLDPIVPLADAAPFPDAFDDAPDFFRWVHGTRWSEIATAWDAWKRERTLAAFVAYLQVGSPDHVWLVRTRTQEWTEPTPDGPGARALDAALASARASGARVVVAVMPEHPVLAQDTAGEFHRPGASDRTTALIRTLAAAHGATVWDARHVLPLEAFIDFDHVLAGPGGLESRLAVVLEGDDAA